MAGVSLWLMQILVLGGTAWVGKEVVRAALERGHTVTALARGESGCTPPGARFVCADREVKDAYADVRDQDWDGVIDVSWQPGQVRSALAALAEHTRTWAYVSSCSVYAQHDVPGQDESAALLPAFEGEVADADSYGPAKVGCEQAVTEAMGPGHCTLARSGLITGPGDHTDRTGYWPLRFARPAARDGSVLVPTSPQLVTQVIDARDLATWLVNCVKHEVAGAYNAIGPVLPLEEHLAAARSVGGHTGELVEVDQDWLAEHEVQAWSGPRSLPIWLPLPEYAGFSSRQVSAAAGAGLRTRPLESSMRDTLAWELASGPTRERAAGLSTREEQELIAAGRAS